MLPAVGPDTDGGADAGDAGDDVGPTLRERVADWVSPERREESLDWLLTILALLLGPLILLPYEVPLPAPVAAALVDLAWVVWGVFVVQFVARIARSEERGLFMLRHVADLAVIVMPVLQLPHLAGPEIGRIWWAMAATGRGLVGLRRLFQNQGSLYLMMIGLVVVGSAANFVKMAERTNPDALITSYGDALWWTFVTMSSTGYGDKFPLTATGRVIGVGLMIVGLAIFGVFTARMAGYFVAVEESKSDAMLADLDSRLHQLEQTILATAERQKSMAGKAMRIAKRTKSRQRKQTGGRKEAGGEEESTGVNAKRRAADRADRQAGRQADRQAEKAAPAARTAKVAKAPAKGPAKPDRADRKAERQADRRAERRASGAPEASPSRPTATAPAVAAVVIAPAHPPLRPGSDGSAPPAEAATPTAPTSRLRSRPTVVRRVDLGGDDA